MLQGFGIAQRVLMEQVLKRTPIVQTTAHLRDELVGNIKREAASLRSAVKHVAGMLFALEASLAVLADTSSTAETQGTQGGRPKAGSLFLEPLGDIGRKFFLGWHAVYVPHSAYTVKHNRIIVVNSGIYEFRDRN